MNRLIPMIYVETRRRPEELDGHDNWYTNKAKQEKSYLYNAGHEMDTLHKANNLIIRHQDTLGIQYLDKHFTSEVSQILLNISILDLQDFMLIT